MEENLREERLPVHGRNRIGNDLLKAEGAEVDKVAESGRKEVERLDDPVEESNGELVERGSVLLNDPIELLVGVLGELEAKKVEVGFKGSFGFEEILHWVLEDLANVL